MWRWIVVAAVSAGLARVVRADARAEVVPPAPFAVVLIDAKTEAALGAFPYDRGVYAKGIDVLASAKAHGVVLKFFIDEARTEKGDAALAEAMAKTKVVLQAELREAEAKPNPLPDRFALRGVTAAKGARPLGAQSGVLPMPAVAARAWDLGFIDSTTSVELVPTVERYRGRYVKSLYAAALELAAGERATIVAGESLKLRGKTIATDERSFARVRLPAADGLRAHSFSDLIAGKIDPKAFADRVVIVGYDGAKMPENETPIGKVKGHRLFCYQLFSLWEELKPGAKD